VQQLAAPRQVDRAVAVRELEALGPEILKYLPVNEAVSDPAVRDALTRLRKVLEKRLAMESVQPALVSLSGSEPVRDIVAALETQSKNRIGVADGVDASNSFAAEWNRVPFWAAVDAIARKQSLHVQWNSAGNRWELGQLTDEERDIAAAISGPFRVTVRSVAWKSLPDSTQRLLRVGLAVQAESRLRPLFFAVSPGDWTGEMGQSKLSAWNPSAELELPFGENGREVEWTLDLVVPADITPATCSLHGKAKVHIAAGTEPFVFEEDRLQPGSTMRRGDVTVRLHHAAFEAAEQGTQMLTVRMTISYATGGPAFESHRIGMFQRSARLETKSGKTVPVARFDVLAEADGGLVLEYRFTGLTEPRAEFRFIYEAPTLLLNAPLEVAFPQLPAPRG